MKKFLVWVSIFLFATTAYGLSTIVKPYTFTAHTGAAAAQVNANEDTEISAINAIVNEITAGTGALNVNSVTSTTFNSYSTSQSAIARHIAVRDSNGKLAGDILGNAATATTSTSATNADTVDTFHASATPGASVVPVGDSNGRIAWGAKPSFRGALVYNNGATSTGNFIAFSAESYDTDAIHDNSTNNTRLTVPAGVTKVKILGKASSMNASTSSVIHIIMKNGAGNYLGSINAGMTLSSGAISTGIILLSTPVLSVTAGDYFQLYCGVDVNADANGYYNWFAMEIIE